MLILNEHEDKNMTTPIETLVNEYNEWYKTFDPTKKFHGDGQPGAFELRDKLTASTITPEIRTALIWLNEFITRLINTP